MQALRTLWHVVVTTAVTFATAVTPFLNPQLPAQPQINDQNVSHVDGTPTQPVKQSNNQRPQNQQRTPETTTRQQNQVTQPRTTPTQQPVIQQNQQTQTQQTNQPSSNATGQPQNCTEIQNYCNTQTDNNRRQMCNNFYNENCTNGRTYNPQNRTQTNNQTNQQPAAQVQTRPVPSNQQTQTRPVTAPTTPPQTTLPSSQPVPQPAGGNIPLTDMGSSLYLGQFSGGLYANGANEPPAEHRAAGLSAAANIRPLDTNGNPSANGKIVMISVGMSNTTMEFCNSQNAASPNVPGTECNPWTFAGQASTDSRVNHSTLVIINCARGGQAAANWIDAHAHNTDNNTHNNYDLCRDNHMTPHGVTENQVQIAWVKVADPLPPASLPATNADAYTLENEIGQIVRALKVRYPHIQQVYLGSRIYSYDHTLPPRSFNGEPLAYESGFAVKWAVQAQIDQMRNGGRISDNHAGDLNYNSYPWIAWGPYFWSNGTTPRSQGTTCDPAGISWSTTDLLNDRTHPSQVGQEKVGRKLLDFFLCSPFSASWFSASGRSISPR